MPLSRHLRDISRSAVALLATVPGPALLSGLLLLAVIIGGHAARLVCVPRVVGCLVGGSRVLIRGSLQFVARDAL